MPRNTGPCYFCPGTMSWRDIFEGVTWEMPVRSAGYPGWWFAEDDNSCICHRRCWKAQDYGRLELIRAIATEPPRSFGALI